MRTSRPVPADSQPPRRNHAVPPRDVRREETARGPRTAAPAESLTWRSPLQLATYRDHQRGTRMRFHYTGSERLPQAVTVQDGSGAATYLLGYDQVGSLKAVAAMDGPNEGRVVKVVDYDAFGNVLSDSNPALFLPLAFAGGLRDRFTGLVRFCHRDYDPTVGRFTAPDPLGDTGGDHDPYDYCVDEPVGRVDPEGLQAVATPGAKSSEDYMNDILCKLGGKGGILPANKLNQHLSEDDLIFKDGAPDPQHATGTEDFPHPKNVMYATGDDGTGQKTGQNGNSGAGEPEKSQNGGSASLLERWGRHAKESITGYFGQFKEKPDPHKVNPEGTEPVAVDPKGEKPRPWWDAHTTPWSLLETTGYVPHGVHFRDEVKKLVTHEAEKFAAKYGQDNATAKIIADKLQGISGNYTTGSGILDSFQHKSPLDAADRIVRNTVYDIVKDQPGGKNATTPSFKEKGRKP